MRRWNELHELVKEAAGRHSKLAAKFREFAGAVKEHFVSPDSRLGISVALHLERDYFTVTFAARTLYFTFSPALSEDGSLVGIVKCDLKRDFPEELVMHVGSFTLASNGETNLTNPESGQPFNVVHDMHSPYIGLHYIYESLSR